MHSLYFVRLAKQSAKNSEGARNLADSILETNGFNAQRGFWASGKGDWYVIGGRWSGELTRLTLKKDFFEEVKKEIPFKYDAGYTKQEIKANDGKLQALWETLGGTGRHPYGRDSYGCYGAEDDALMMTSSLVKKLQSSDKWQDVEVAYCDEYDDVVEEAKISELKAEDLVDSWLVVVDYHL